MTDIHVDHLLLHRRAHIYQSANDADHALSTLLSLDRKRHRRRVIASGTTSFGAQGGVEFSFAVYKLSSTPSFLVKSAPLTDEYYGLVALASRPPYLAVHCAGGTTWSDTALSDQADRIDAATVARALHGANKIRKLSTRNMAISSSVIRGQSYEADDLSNSLPQAGQNRRMIQLLRVKTKDDGIYASPSTGLLGAEGPRVTVADYCAWFDTLVAQITQPSSFAFLSQFAQPIRTSEMPSGTSPIGVLLDLSFMEDLLNGGAYVALKSATRAPRRLPDSLVRKALELYGEIGTVAPTTNSGVFDVSFPGSAPPVTLRENKQSYTIFHPRMRQLAVCHPTGEQESLPEVLRNHRSLQIAMSDIRYAYAFGQLFHDKQIAAQAGTLLPCITSNTSFLGVTSEKHESLVTPTSNAFPPNSLFASTENSVAAGETWLLCGDSTSDEWADYIGLTCGTSESITLYHCKHGKPGTSASAFQTVLGQALKNLGRLSITADEAQRRAKEWSSTWRTKSKSLKRVRRRPSGSTSTFGKEYARISASASYQRRVVVVASFASAKSVSAVLSAATKGTPLKAHQTQLVLLLVAFVSACRDIGAEAKIVCAP